METLERQDLKKALSGKRIGSLTKRDITTLRREINQKLESLELTYGIQLRVGNIRYDSVSFRTKLEGKLLSPSGGESVDAVQFKRNCFHYGLQPSDFNKKIILPSHGRFSGKRGKITGINTRSRKYPILVTLDDGRKVKNAASFIKDLLK